MHKTLNRDRLAARRTPARSYDRLPACRGRRLSNNNSGPFATRMPHYVSHKSLPPDGLAGGGLPACRGHRLPKTIQVSSVPHAPLTFCAVPPVGGFADEGAALNRTSPSWYNGADSARPS